MEDFYVRTPGRRDRTGGALRRSLRKTLLLLLLYYLVVPPFVHPVRGRVTSGYFIREAPDQLILPSTELHGGLDIAAPAGRAVVAAKSGRVVRRGTAGAPGNHLEIRHWLGFSTYYAHLGSLSAREGGYVLKGTRIGTVGTSGRSTGPHVHFEVRFRGVRLPPGLFLAIDGARHRIVGLLYRLPGLLKKGPA